MRDARRPRRVRRHWCSCTVGRRPPTSTSSPATRRSPNAGAWWRSITAATGAGCERAARSGSRTAPTTPSRVADALGIDTFIPVGYSMGGPVAQLIVAAPSRPGRRPGAVRDRAVLRRPAAGAARRSSGSPDWRRSPASRRRRRGLDHRPGLPAAQERVVERLGDRAGSHHDWRMVLEAGRAIGAFSSSDWIARDRRADLGRDHDARSGGAAAASGASCSSGSPAPRRSGSTVGTTAWSPRPTSSCRNWCGRSQSVVARIR